MSSFFADPAVGGDGTTTTDDTSATTGLANGGFWTRLVPMFTNVVNIANNAKTSATNSAASAAASAASAATAASAPGTNATSTTSLTLGSVQQTLTIQTGKSIVAGMLIQCAKDSANYFHGPVDSYNSGTGVLLFTPDKVVGSGTYTAWTISLSGAVGDESGAVRIEYTFSTTTTDADPGNGTLRLDNATQNLATTIRTDLLDRLGVDMTSVLGTLTASTSGSKGTIRLVKRGDPSKFLLLNMTAMASPAGYRNITCSVQASSSASPFANGDYIVLHFSRTGDTAGSGGLITGNISAGRTMDSTYAGVQIVTPTAVGVKDTLPDATTLSTGIGNYFHKNTSDTFQHGLSDKGGTLRAVIGPNGKASSNLADKGTVAGVWGIECDNEDGALALCEQTLASTYTGVVTLQDGNGGASIVNHARKVTARFISSTAAVAVVTSGSSTYLVGFDDTGLSTPQLLEAAVASTAIVVRTSATGGFVVWGRTTTVKVAGFTMTGNAPSVGSVTALSASITPTANSSGAGGGLAWIVLDSGTTWVVNAAASGTTGSLFALTQSGNTVTAGAALTAIGTGGMPMLFSTGATTFGQIGYQSGPGAVATLQTNTVTGNTIANTASANYVASTTTNSIPVSVGKLTGTALFAFTYNDGSTCKTNIATFTTGTAFTLGSAVDTTLGIATVNATAINIYDATRYAVWNGGLTAATLTPKYLTNTAGSPVLTSPGTLIGNSTSVLVGFLDNATALYADNAASAAAMVKLRKISFSGSAFAGGAVVEAPSNQIADFTSGGLGITLCGGVAVTGYSSITGGMKFSFLNKGRSMKYVPRLAVGAAAGGSLVDANSTGTRAAACVTDFNSAVIPLMLEIPTY